MLALIAPAQAIEKAAGGIAQRRGDRFAALHRDREDIGRGEIEAGGGAQVAVGRVRRRLRRGNPPLEVRDVVAGVPGVALRVAAGLCAGILIGQAGEHAGIEVVCAAHAMGNAVGCG